VTAVTGYDLHGVRVLECAREGPSLEDYAVLTQVVGEALARGADWVVLPTERLGARFFDLSTGVAGEIVQKFVTYGCRVAIVGDVSAYAAKSGALRDFVRESNRGAHVWFVADMAALSSRLGD
jgi:hypothetical protein